MRLWRLLAAATVVLTLLASAQGVLEALAKDDYEQAWALLAANPAVAEEIAKMDPEKQAALAALGPDLLKLLDAAIPEERLLQITGG